MSVETIHNPPGEWTVGKAVWLVILAGLIAPLALGLLIGAPMSLILLISALSRGEYPIGEVVGPLLMAPFFSLMFASLPGVLMGLAVVLWRFLRGAMNFRAYLALISPVGIGSVWLAMFFILDEEEVVAGLAGGFFWGVIGILFACLFWAVRRQLGLRSLSE